MSAEEHSSSLIDLTPVEAAPHVCVITLNRPKRRNAFNNEMADELADTLDAFESDPAYRVAILRGNGPIFCAGMDLVAFAAGERPGLDTANGFAHFVRRPRSKPIVAAVQGGAHGGGFEIMLACDLVVAESDTKMSMAEVKRGIIAGGGGAARLASRIPAMVAREMLFTGNPITAARAYELGLVNAVVPADELEAASLKLAVDIAANAPLAVRGTKAIVDESLAADELQGWYASSRIWDKVTASEDAIEGVVAFKERRQPIWRGK